MEELEERFGDIFAISREWIKQIKAFPTMKVENIDLLEKLLILLKKCQNAIKQCDSIHSSLNHPEIIHLIIQKLPTKFRERFRSFNHDKKIKNKTYKI